MDFATTNFRHVRVVESTPARNVASCVGIGIGGKPARLTRELVACGPVLFADAATRRALPRRVARVNKLHRHSEKPALVSDFRLEIGERPRVQHAALLSVSSDPRSNAPQIFQGNSALRAFSNTANLFGNNVIYVAHKSFFSATKPPQYPISRSSALSLKPLTLPPAASANTGNPAGITESLPIGTLGEIDQAKVDAKPSDRFLFSFFRNVHRYVEIPLTVAHNQITFAFRKLKQFALTFSTDKWNMFEPSGNRPNAHGRGGKLEIKDSSVVRNTAVLAEIPLNLLVQLVGVGDLGVQPDDNLRGECELGSNPFVKEPVHGELPELLLFPAQFRKPIGSVVCHFQRLAQRRRLFGCRQKFNLHSQFHWLTLLQRFEYVK